MVLGRGVGVIKSTICLCCFQIRAYPGLRREGLCCCFIGLYWFMLLHVSVLGWGRWVSNSRMLFLGFMHFVFLPCDNSVGPCSFNEFVGLGFVWVLFVSFMNPSIPNNFNGGGQRLPSPPYPRSLPLTSVWREVWRFMTLGRGREAHQIHGWFLLLFWNRVYPRLRCEGLCCCFIGLYWLRC